MRFKQIFLIIFLIITSSLFSQTDPIRIICMENSIIDGHGISHPPSYFNDNYSIRNNVIVNKIIPEINQVHENTTEVSLIDFYTNIPDAEYLFPNGIHPSVNGAWKMAQMFTYSISNVEIKAVSGANLARSKHVNLNNFKILKDIKII